MVISRSPREKSPDGLACSRMRVAWPEHIGPNSSLTAASLTRDYFVRARLTWVRVCGEAPGRLNQSYRVIYVCKFERGTRRSNTLWYRWLRGSCLSVRNMKLLRFLDHQSNQILKSNIIYRGLHWQFHGVIRWFNIWGKVCDWNFPNKWTCRGLAWFCQGIYLFPSSQPPARWV